MLQVETDAEGWPESDRWTELADRAVRAAIAHSPDARFLTDPMTVEVSGAAHLPESVRGRFLGGRLPDGSATVLRLEGLAASVAVRAEKLGSAMAPFGAVSVLDAGLTQQLWREIRDVHPFADGTARPVMVMATRRAAAAAAAEAVAACIMKLSKSRSSGDNRKHATCHNGSTSISDFYTTDHIRVSLRYRELQRGGISGGLFSPLLAQLFTSRTDDLTVGHPNDHLSFRGQFLPSGRAYSSNHAIVFFMPVTEFRSISFAAEGISS